MSTLLVAVMLIGMVLFVITSFLVIEKRKRKRRIRAILDHFSRRGTHYRLAFTSQELINDTVIGIDGIRKLMLVVRKTPKGSVEQLIDLSRMKSCLSKRIDGTVGRNGHYPEKLVLQIRTADEGVSCEIPFYSHIHNDIYDLKEAEKKASHWEEVLKKMAAV